ncbi:MAG TPA: tRNA uridine-5-carboxymethylaminomethyl(34) synthesis enzyme MnmG, partial [Phycisphaerae bacterium]|nr:tRNA uridine-5-carboxymethylaminomethyl(34) synthesis enzyme MnmG [Phycisphaerae bacterium]
LRQAHPDAVESLCIDARYAGYIAREAGAIRQMQQLDAHVLPEWIDYAAVPQLRHEARERLAQVRPRSLGQALRISGITPADITVLTIHLAGRSAERTQGNENSCQYG